jgi:hypothetical protein
MATLVEPLAWDSEFFGFPIGRTVLDGATPESLTAIEAEAREMGIVCLYGSLDPSGGDTTAYLVQTFGHRLVEVGVLFSRPAIPFVPRPSASVARHGTIDDVARLDAEIRTLAPWSRFGADPRFGLEAASRMHAAWAERAARDEDRMLAVSEDESGVTGLSTQVRSAIPRIDIMGVTKPGTGASYALMAAFVEWAGEGPIEAGPCAARNVAVLRFLEHCAFLMSSVRYLYHRWLDEDPGAPT